MAIVNQVILSPSAPSPDEYVRPSDWLPIPAITSGEEVIYILMAVYDVIGNFATINIQGNYTVDWGDGNVENVASGVKAEHSFNWADVGNVTTKGFRQALIKVTPQAGQHITIVNFQQIHSSITNYKSSNYIDIVLNIPNVAGGSTSLVISQSTPVVLHRHLERCWIKEVGILTSFAYMFRYCYSLQEVPLFETSQGTDFTGMFQFCYSLQEVPLFNMTKAQTTYAMFFNANSLKKVPAFNLPIATNIKYSFSGCYSLREITQWNAPFASNMDQFAYLCEALISLDVIVPSLTITTSMLGLCYSLQSCLLRGITVGFSVAGSQLSATALNEMFTALGTANGAQTITITGNYGAATCDTSIATAKGYTIVS